MLLVLLVKWRLPPSITAHSHVLAHLEPLQAEVAALSSGLAQRFVLKLTLWWTAPWFPCTSAWS